jgi:hypothetical protein
MKRMKTLIALFILGWSIGSTTYAAETRKISFDEYKDKMRAGWIGQMVGVAWSAPTEFKFCGRIISIDEKTGLPERMEPLTQNTVNQSFSQDDLYVEMIFLESLEKYGLGVSRRQAGIDFANAKPRLYCANAIGQGNTRLGIAPPWSGHPKFNTQPNAIDYQIEADYSGLIAPGLPQVPVDLGEIFGSIMNYSDGIYAGQFVGAMYSEAFFETDMRKVIEKGLEAIPAESQYAKIIREVLQWSLEEPDWQKTWQKIEDKYAGKKYGQLREGETQLLELHDGAIDVRMNGAYIAMGLLYGEGDPVKTTLISTRCGNDSDCNPSNALGILFTSCGLDKVPGIFKDGAKMDAAFSHSPFTLPKLYELCFELAKKAVVKEGGKVIEENSGYFLLPVQAAKPSPYFSAARPEAVPSDYRFTPKEMAQINVETSQLEKEFNAVFPGWKLINCASVANTGRPTPKASKTRMAFTTHPQSEASPVMITKSVEIPKGKTSTLKLSVTGYDGRDQEWELLVRVDMADVFQKVIKGKKKRNKLVTDLQEIDIDLTPYAGKEIMIDLYNRPAPGGNPITALAYWGKIDIVSE